MRLSSDTFYKQEQVRSKAQVFYCYVGLLIPFLISIGQNSARQAAINAGIPDTTPAMCINKVCGSGLKAVHLAAQVSTIISIQQHGAPYVRFLFLLPHILAASAILTYAAAVFLSSPQLQPLLYNIFHRQSSAVTQSASSLVATSPCPPPLTFSPSPGQAR